MSNSPRPNMPSPVAEGTLLLALPLMSEGGAGELGRGSYTRTMHGGDRNVLEIAAGRRRRSSDTVPSCGASALSSKHARNASHCAVSLATVCAPSCTPTGGCSTLPTLSSSRSRGRPRSLPSARPPRPRPPRASSPGSAAPARARAARHYPRAHCAARARSAGVPRPVSFAPSSAWRRYATRIESRRGGGSGSSGGKYGWLAGVSWIWIGA
ncbi:hypothetical protein BJ912DRAFT_236807 [Pholiota molesta]|nr:hypothetical protein BJ912DRAFT_236807 [Pholiota molesta]